MTFLAPCGHPGIPVTVNYVTCTLCDAPQVKKHLLSVGCRTFRIHLFDSAKTVHTINTVKIPNGADNYTAEVVLTNDCYLYSYRFVLCDDSGNIAHPIEAWDNDFTHHHKTIIGAGVYQFTFKVPKIT